TRRLIERLGPDSWERIGTVTDLPLADALLDGLARLLDVDGFEAGRLASRLGGPDRAQHPLRLTLTDADGGLIGGYTVVLG
ncbi:MAG: hypothetical protein JWN06_1107, partial [Propionibacteriaceae bacterium]|nr:hypothetical protein [Propionibacteriaceae bacterium]